MVHPVGGWGDKVVHSGGRAWKPCLLSWWMSAAGQVRAPRAVRPGRRRSVGLLRLPVIPARTVHPGMQWLTVWRQRGNEWLVQPRVWTVQCVGVRRIIEADSPEINGLCPGPRQESCLGHGVFLSAVVCCHLPGFEPLVVFCEVAKRR